LDSCHARGTILSVLVLPGWRDKIIIGAQLSLYKPLLSLSRRNAGASPNISPVLDRIFPGKIMHTLHSC